MKAKRTLSTLLVALGATALLGGSLSLMAARAQNGSKPQPAPTGKITPWQAIKIATGKVPGKALNANFEFDEGHWVYGVFVVTGKTIKEVEIDPVTGKVGDVETVTPEGEATEVKAELNKAIGNPSTDSAEKDEKGEKGEKP